MSASAKHERVLDPIDRLSEILFGLIMVLSFTGSISAAGAGDGEVREVLIGAVGCNLAWGLVDAVMYLLTLLIERGRMLSIGRAVRASGDAEHGRKLLAQALPEPLGALFEGSALESARAKLLALPALRERPHLERRDWLAALGVFLVVFLSTFPVIVPFLVLSPLHVAMRASNGVAIAMLYGIGRALGRHADLGPTRTGLVMVAIGVVLVGVTIALGG